MQSNVKVFQRIGGVEFVRAFMPTIDLEWTKDGKQVNIKANEQYLVRRSDNSLEVINKEEFESSYIQVSK